MGVVVVRGRIRLEVGRSQTGVGWGLVHLAKVSASYPGRQEGATGLL